MNNMNQYIFIAQKIFTLGFTQGTRFIQESKRVTYGKKFIPRLQYNFKKQP